MNYNQIMYALQLARVNAAQDLIISSDILGAVDELVKRSQSDNLSAEAISDIIDKLVNLSMQLTEQSTKLTQAVNKLVGI